MKVWWLPRRFEELHSRFKPWEIELIVPGLSIPNKSFSVKSPRIQVRFQSPNGACHIAGPASDILD